MTSSKAHSLPPVAPVSRTKLRPVTGRIEGGIFAEWQRRNIEATVPHSIQKLFEYGHVSNFQRLVSGERVPFSGFVFADSDLHKAMEGFAWTPPDQGSVDGFFEDVLTMYEKVQAEDGYLNSAFQGWDAKQAAWSDFPQGHELYALGHLIQAGIAAARAGRGTRLLAVARRFADLAVELFGGPDRPEVPGHPEIEMALVELYRETAHRPYLELAVAFVERRGHGWLGSAPHGPYYYQDAVTLRETRSLHGHAVRAAYLCAGAADVAIETEDTALIAHLDSLWDDMVATKMYLTGGIGSRHRDEAFGDAYELPSERAYTETCAAIGLVQWAWRMLLATGKAKYAEYIERALFNAFSVGLSEDGRAFFYSNPLQRRVDHLPSQEEGAGKRLPWFHVSCCPPNIIRTMATLQHYLATQDDDGLQIHIPADATLSGEIDRGQITVRVRSGYPWQARFTVTVDETPPTEWTLRFRLPAGCTEVTVDGNGAPTQDGYLVIRRAWQPGDEMVIAAEMPVREVRAHPHVDALRGTVAFLRGPLVYCAEAVDNADDIDDLVVPVGGGATVADDERPVTIMAAATRFDVGGSDLYVTDPRTPVASPSAVQLVPYFTWGNRTLGAMRVWLRAGEPRP